MESDKKGIVSDVFGIATYGEALKISVEKGFNAAESVLSRICLPAAEELGIMFRDKVRYWRLNNIIKIINKSEGKFDFSNGQLELTAHPRVIQEIIENGSWCDDDTLQEMWAGLLVSSCNEEEGDDSNLIFVNTLKQLTKSQVKILNFICTNCSIKVDKNGFLYADHISITFEQLTNIIGAKNIHQIDSELDFLRSNELLMTDILDGHTGGFVFGMENISADLEPSPFAINLFLKAQGYKGEPKNFFNIEYLEPEN